VFGTAGTVRRAEPLRHDAFASELAGLPVDDIAVADVVLIDGDARMWAAQQLDKLGLSYLNGRALSRLIVE
jgi:hypothetical protein